MTNPAGPRIEHRADPPFTASAELADSSPQMHVDLTDLHLPGQHAHWNVAGKHFRARSTSSRR